jgi:hypothetical protein
MMYKIKGDGPGVRFNVGLSDADKVELDSMSLETILARHKAAFSCGSSLYRGVGWDKVNHKWQASISLGSKSKHLGRFLLEKEAALAYDRAAKEMNGRCVTICFSM